MVSIVKPPSKAELLASLRKSVVPFDKSQVKLKALLYGVSGVGKTIEALELASKVNPTGKRILYIDTGEGWVSVLNHKHLQDNVDRMVFEGLAQFEALVDVIAAEVDGFNNYSTIIFDEFSTVAKKDIHIVVNETMDKTNQFQSAEFKQYNIATRRMERVAFKLLELKETHHLIFIAHERVDKDDITKISVRGPSFMAKFGETLKENMHVVGRITASLQGSKGDAIYTREIQVHPSKMVVAKSRVGGLQIQEKLSRFNEVLLSFVNGDGSLVDVQDAVELADEKKVEGQFDDQYSYEVLEESE